MLDFDCICVICTSFVRSEAYARHILTQNRNMKLEDRLRSAIRLKHFSLRTEESYVGWYRRYVHWHGKKHPAEMGEPEVEAFLALWRV